VIILALVIDGGFAITQRLVVPAGVRATRSTDLHPGPTRPRVAVGQPITEGNQE
jgi:osmoprotectant transport system permease protein